MLHEYQLYSKPLNEINRQKLLINTLNAHSFNTTKSDQNFKEAIKGSDILLPDGIGVVLAMRLLNGLKIKKIAGADLFQYEMKRVNAIKGKCFFLGSSESTLQKIKERAAIEYPQIQVFTYSPPYKSEFTEEESMLMVDKVNAVEPDVLFIGMTAPKQEKWAYTYIDKLKTGHVCCIGAVFDFFAGTVHRAPEWMIGIGMEWFYRLVKEPKRMWRRYLIGNTKFIGYVLREKMSGYFQNYKNQTSNTNKVFK